MRHGSTPAVWSGNWLFWVDMSIILSEVSGLLQSIRFHVSPEKRLVTHDNHVNLNDGPVRQESMVTHP